ncbi:Alkaline ceramidase 1 [Macaca mulatta]|uniref:Alkaline ceramidase n=4 Tax=Macaca TaxID=9539 RepID=F6U4Z7_MACMU|nr:alkaline ceramidase 1 isoform X2 [Macaca mulatta]XP_005587750.2 alkaline ceramidase 1 isoform X1 [Macaca fascicularis]EHH29527.1 Alkaline ceramidase 1 [Macaca mulatta]EHH59108.1 Alkaline ceramidase 1 [Macaca fascicularis]
MPSIFAYQSSEVDWCESNFQYSELVAEFYNTFTNIPFFIFGPLMMLLMHPYAQKRSRYIYVFWVLFMIIGLFSMYFHMTLSFLGQLLDEIAILWLLGSGYSIWMPRCYFPSFLGGNRSQFIRLVFVTTVVSTPLSFLRPTVNAYVLNSIALHIVYIVCQEYRKTSNKELRHLIEVSVVLWAIALTSWISDRLLCNFWQRIHFFYLHSIWHVLISITFPYGMVTMALVDANYEMPGETLKVRYWPRDNWPVGLPYVEIRGDDKNC